MFVTEKRHLGIGENESASLLSLLRKWMACARNPLNLRAESDSHVRQRRPTRSAVIIQASHVYKKEADSFLPGVYFLHYEESVNNFREVVNRRPTWGAARIMLAHSLGHLAENEDRMDCLDEAVREIGIARALVKPNAWILSVSLFVDLKVIQLRTRHGLAPSTWEPAREDALVVASILRNNYPDNTLGNWVMAGFYDTIGDKESAEETWRRLLHTGGDFSYCAIGWLYEHYTSEETLQLVQRLQSEHPLIRAAEACIMADLPDRRDEARRIYQELIPQSSSLFVRAIVVRIPLLLGECEEASRECQEWCRDYEQAKASGQDTSSVGQEELALRLIAGLPATEGAKHGRTDLLRQFSIEYTEGLLSLSKGDRDAALAHFKACVAIGGVRADVVWARAFIERLTNDPDWPRGNRRLHPEIGQERG
jgi:tetratricopeptide (TPR) repeat protein